MSDRLADTITPVNPDVDDDHEEGQQVATVVSITPVLLNREQVSALVGGISERKLRELVSAGKFPKPVDGLGRLARWRRSDVEAWAAGLKPRK